MREQISKSQSKLLTWTLSILSVLYLTWVVLVLVYGSITFREAILAGLILFPLAMSRRIVTVSIDENNLYVEKRNTEIAIRPENIEDVKFWFWSKYLVLKFKSPTEFGRSVLFEPGGGSGALDSELLGANAFEKIGRLCGWRK